MDIAQKKKIIVVATIIALSLLLLLLLGFLIAVLFSGNSSIITVPGNVISSETGEDGKSESIRLHYETTNDNKSFVVMNMLPGDSLMSDYAVNVSHKEDVSLYFNTSALKQEDKLAEVLMIKVELRDSETVIYNGTMRDMPEKLEVNLTADGETNTKVRFRITAWMDTSVGNEYQGQTLATTLNWWIEDTDALYYPYGNDGIFEVDTFPLWLLILIIILSILSVAGIVAVVVISNKMKNDAESASIV